jgi:curved DNA-binding protein CbpA
MNIQELRDLYRKYAVQLHPDKPTGDHEKFTTMQNEYETVLKEISENEKIKAGKENRDPFFTFEGESEIMEMLKKAMRVKNIIIEICGSWLWISGNTFPVHEVLRSFGMRYSKKKKAWYFSPYMSKKRKAGRYSMKKIRNTFGSTILDNKEEEQKEIAN